ncbi:MAG: lactate/malate dehydrogenase family protein [Sulfolobaceae archaeon]
MVRVGIVGVGKLGQTIAYSIASRGLVDEMILYDIVPELAEKVEHEFRHALASLNIKTEIKGTDKIEEVEGTDIILIVAGKPRKPGMSRRDLFTENAKIMIDLSKKLPPKNPNALYIMVTNPVDMMASVFQRFSGKFTISTGNQVETMRMRAFIASKLKVPVSEVDGFVAGEHGEEAFIVWSSVKVKGKDFDSVAAGKLTRQEVEKYVKEIAAEIIRVLGGTTWGPGTIIADIVKAIVYNENRVMSIAMPFKYEDEIIHLSVPTVISHKIGPTLQNIFDENELKLFHNTQKNIYKVYKENLNHLLKENL